jgi:serine/threonine protein kinase
MVLLPGTGGIVTIPSAALRPGGLLRGRYEIQETLRSARGKRIFLAHDRELGCRVAVDVFSEDRVMPGGMTVSAWEARVLGQLGDHANIATVLDHWEEAGTAVMVTRYLSGGSLRDLIERSLAPGGRIPAENILRISAEIARALACIHSRRILYRDLQPRNVLFDEWGTAHLVDFDTAVPLDGDVMGGLQGSPVTGYTAPELAGGRSADNRADLYSLGATVYAMCSGQPPFTGTREEILAASRSGPPPSPSRADLPRELLDFVLRLLDPAPSRRPGSTESVVSFLEALHTHGDIERLLASDETATLEFKSSLCMPVQAKPGDSVTEKELRRVMQQRVLQAIAAFHNTEGGTLIIGVTDDRKVIGIEVDYPALRKPNSDYWRQTFDSLVSDYLGPAVMTSVKLQLEPWNEKTIAIIRCLKRDEPTWLGDDLFIRRTTSTKKLATRDAVAWCRQNWRLAQRQRSGDLSTTIAKSG